MAQPVTNAMVSLLAGALLSAALIGAFAMLFLEVPVGDEPRWIVRPQHFIVAFPWAVLLCAILFLVLGPMLHWALRQAGIASPLSTALGGGLALSLLSSAVSGEFIPYLSGTYFGIGCIGAGLSSALHRRLVSARNRNGSIRVSQTAG